MHLGKGGGGRGREPRGGVERGNCSRDVLKTKQKIKLDCFRKRNFLLGLERELSCLGHLFVSAETWILFSVPTWLLTTIHNSNSKGSEVHSDLSTQQTHTWYAHVQAGKHSYI